MARIIFKYCLEITVVFLCCTELSALTCFDCVEPCGVDPPMCGGLYCVQLRATNKTFYDTILHTCLNKNEVTANVTLNIDVCYALSHLDPNWQYDLQVQTKTNINLTDFDQSFISLCEIGDDYCNMTSCSDFEDIQSTGSRFSRFIILPVTVLYAIMLISNPIISLLD